ncbi:thiol reductant ABC exporter subunit CydC [Celeribacter halophilus]|uniref:Thiol reductant ABC exporter subunit CydC n=1 Tax=Celeribacter halophilus TaxID=576117 RepID=A0AAW7XSV8_9RHOB|nr:thiol reductant ABC exporter subunit CydC [Celeribacter halophilus]MDO6457438.1 thiol reductant ABC exporter subunit CydC [Celeribacter halophilus]MDO6724401.1 thiol reductant ABC exporter subunit CydC [Celeribacter halophilus]
MRKLWHIFRLMVQGERKALLRGLALSILVLIMGVSLLGLSGWFIVAASAAGLIGTGVVFDVFRPSAMVRFLAIGRTATRYGERILTHDATLRALAKLRVTLLAALSTRSHDRLIRLRGAQALNRIVADVDALDGVPLRLFLPLIAGGMTQLLALAVLSWLVDWRVAVVIFATFTFGGLSVVLWGIRQARQPSRRAESAAQAFRSRFIDLVTSREDLTVYGQLPDQVAACQVAEKRRQAAATTTDLIERQAGAGLMVISALAAGAALWIGGGLAEAGEIAPARAAIGFFAALALMETVAPLRRSVAEMGRMIGAARRVTELTDVPDLPERRVAPSGPVSLRFDAVTFGRGTAAPVLKDFTLSVTPGEWVALKGPSGVGKSTVLLLAAGALVPGAGRVCLDDFDVADFSDGATTLVGQRAALVQGSLADNLRLAAPETSDAELWAALDAVALRTVVEAKGGLEARLGPRGAGLSGGEARRLVLARAILRKPSVLLLDEPTEGLDTATADQVLAGLRQMLPDSAVLMAAHRAEEQGAADRIVTLGA